MNLNRFKQTNLYKGRSMIEMLGVLALMGILTAATFQMYNYASNKSKAMNMEDQINQTAEDVKTLFLGRNWDGFQRISDRTSSEKYFEDKKIKLRDAWGNPIYILRTETKDQKLARFYIQLNDIEAADCVNLGKRINPTLLRVNNLDVKPGQIPLCQKDKKNVMQFFYR